MTMLALSTSELDRISELLGREPSLVELYAFDAGWSEHCSYKSSRAHLRKLPTEGASVLLGVGEDAGILDLGEVNGVRYGVVVAHESHNHPSQVVPYEGAATGIGGIVRDVLCMGGELIGVLDPLRFGRTDLPGRAHQRYVAQSVVDGVGGYGNAIGVPNLGGDVYWDESFDDNCLVNVVALGLVRADEIVHSRVPPQADGWNLVLVGKATDASGFGGAAFSSLTLDEERAETNKGAVQVPDPFLKSVLMRATYRVLRSLRDLGVREPGFKDLGAGGVLGCSSELVAAGGMGAEIDLDAVHVSVKDLPAEVIAVGETQERMLWAVPPGPATELLLRVYNDEFGLPHVSRGARASVIGRVRGERRFTMRHRGAVVVDVPVDVLTEGIRYEREVAAAPRRESEDPVLTGRVSELLPRVLAHRDVCSREPLIRHYDRVVRGTTVIPAGHGDAGVIAPIPGAALGVAVSVDGNPRYGKLDARVAAELAVCESARNVAAVGGEPIGLTDCLNFGNPTKPAQMGELVEAIDGLSSAARALGLPYVSGNVSLYNESAAGSSVAPSPIVACIGRVADVSRTAGFAFKRAGSAIVLLGARSGALGGSVVAEVCGASGGRLPRPSLDAVLAEIALVRDGFADGSILSAHDVSDGGLLACLAEMCLGPGGENGIGARIVGPAAWAPGLTEQAAWFGEAGGFALEVEPAAAEGLIERARVAGVTAARLGETTAEPLLSAGEASFALSELAASWLAPLEELYA
ncbi:MAG TPA: phosphoribosylformylglycinamidine synthase subunit PurL [Candidatus Dormibacteraeota bacterium]|nr:phosphoribosylformylglycinamidine synthase subunit PurL [Candidatus Dormibacteraeota bacterium]